KLYETASIIVSVKIAENLSARKQLTALKTEDHLMMQANHPAVVCTQCSFVNSPQTLYCAGCGASFLRFAPTRQVTSESVVPATFLQNLQAAQACPSCNNALPQGSRFCNNCGRPIHHSQPPKPPSKP